MRKSAWAGVALLALVPALWAIKSAATPTSPAAEAYLMQAIGIIRQHHINSAHADWNAIIARARRAAAGAQTSVDTYAAINGVFADLGERHSFLKPPETESGDGAGAGNMPRLFPTVRLIDGHIGAVALPALDTLGSDGRARGDVYRATLRTDLTRLDQQPLCGWLIDLRNNGGGNMWPMLQGLDPLLGAAPFGYFISPSAETAGWRRMEGTIGTGPAKEADAKAAFALAHADAPVAVLIGPGTASSGEMTAIALIGRNDVRTFGAATAGFTTGNVPIGMPDGANLIVTEVFIRDRTGRNYKGAIQPDVPVGEGEAEHVAIQWLEGRCDRRD